MTSKSVLVTGVSGLIGYAVAAELARQGRDVFGFVRRPFHEGSFPTYEADLSDIHRLHGFFREHSVDSIVHRGALSGPMVARDNPHGICRTNIMGAANILEVARIQGVRRVIYTSSTATYGNTPPRPVGERTELRPIGVYRASKASGEYLVHTPGPDPLDTLEAEFDISAAKRDLGYTARFTLAQGIEA
jgi:UDP-glucuronate 4-epimerase